MNQKQIKIPPLSIELSSDTITYKAGASIEGHIHCNFLGKAPAYTKNTILTLEFSGTERSKWEVPDKDKVSADNQDEYLEYGGKNDIVCISRVVHKFL